MAREKNWMQERNERRAAGGGDPHGEEHGDAPLEGPLSDETPMGQNTDDRQIGQYTGEGKPAQIKK
ncbi:MAG TPA: hypothetical protein VFE42_14830 [Chloroflexota bacterium]|nr:hypothetical protein [Chloroflexota bacterium]